MKISPFSLLLTGIVIYALGALMYVYIGHGHAWILFRFAAAGCFFSAFLWQYTSHQFPPEYRRFATVFLCILAYVALISVPEIIRYIGFSGWRAAFAVSAAMYGFIAFGLTLLTLNYSQLTTILKAMIVVGIGTYVLLLPEMDAGWVAAAKDRSQAFMIVDEDRSAYKFQMSLAYLFLANFLVVYAFRMSWSWRMAAIGGLSFVLITAFYYSKRATLLDLAVALGLFFFVYGFLTGRFRGFQKVRILWLGFVTVATLTLGTLFFQGQVSILVDRLLSRFEDLTMLGLGGLSNFSRIYEVRAWFEQADPLTRMLGGGTHYYHVSAITGEWTSNLHIGWAMLYLKGGPPLVFFFLWIFMRNFFVALKSRHRPSAAVGITLSLLFTFSLMHSTVFGQQHGSFAVALGLFLFPALYRLESRGLAIERVGASIPPARRSSLYSPRPGVAGPISHY